MFYNGATYTYITYAVNMQFEASKQGVIQNQQSWYVVHHLAIFHETCAFPISARRESCSSSQGYICIVHVYSCQFINPRRACAARGTVVVLCVCVCVSVRSFLPPCACRSQNIGTNGFIAMQKTFTIVFFAKNVSFRSYGIMCLPRMPPTTLKPQKTDTKGISGRLESH